MTYSNEETTPTDRAYQDAFEGIYNNPYGYGSREWAEYEDAYTNATFNSELEYLHK